MSTVVVAGFTTADIHFARDAAGVGGTVQFPAGEYESDDLRSNIADQTWKLDRKAVIKRTDSTTSAHILQSSAENFRLRGGTLDGNRFVNPNASNGISAYYDLDLRDVEIVNMAAWGVNMTNGKLVMKDCAIRRSGYAGIYWRITPGYPPTQGPSLDGVLVDRSIASDYISSGGIHIVSEVVGIKAHEPKVRFCKVILPQGSQYSSVAFEFIKCERGAVIGNTVVGGRIGYSLGESNFFSIVGNSARYCSSYGLELANNTDQCTGTGNVLMGNGGLHGIVISAGPSGGSDGNMLMGNKVTGWTNLVTIVGSAGNVNQFNQ